MPTRIHFMSPTDSIFDSSAECLVNPVNCVGVSGAGLAKEFKRRFPEQDLEYVAYCRQKRLRPGEILYLRQSDFPVRRQIAYAATKDLWQNRSRLDWIESICVELASGLVTSSVAIPALGCGCGELRWADVRRVIFDAFKDSAVEVFVYPPR